MRRTTRAALLITGAGAFIFACSLFLLPQSTDRFFAWTIAPPLTAAFLGVDYWGAAALCYLSARARTWSEARAFGLPFLVGGTLLLIVTLVHLDRFHMDGVTGWVWLVLYLIFPPAMAFALLRQGRPAGGAPPAPVAPWLRRLLRVEAAVLVALGAALVIAPSAAGPAWPWPLTPLTGRVVGTFVLAQGLLFAVAARDAGARSIRIVLIETALVHGLQLVAVLRFTGDVQWAEPTAWLYVAVLAVNLAAGVRGAQRTVVASR